MWLEPWRTFANVLDGYGLLDRQEAFFDGSFAPAKKGTLQSAKPSAARERGNTNGHAIAPNKENIGFYTHYDDLRSSANQKHARSAASLLRSPVYPTQARTHLARDFGPGSHRGSQLGRSGGNLRPRTAG